MSKSLTTLLACRWFIKPRFCLAVGQGSLVLTSRCGSLNRGCAIYFRMRPCFDHYEGCYRYATDFRTTEKHGQGRPIIGTLSQRADQASEKRYGQVPPRRLQSCTFQLR